MSRFYLGGNMRVKARCLRETFRKDDFRILNWSPYEKKGLELSKYFTFSTKGNDGWADVGKDYELEIELENVHPQFGGTYKIVGVPSVEAEDIASMSIEEKKNILMQCTSSERIADNILSVYPDYIERVLNEGADSIDTKPIQNVGSAYHHAYCRKLFDKYKYFYIFNKYSDYKIDMIDAKKISEGFGSDGEIEEAFKKDPYNVLINICGKSFLSADKIIISLNPQLKETELRCTYLMIDVLDKNEQESGSTRLNGNDLYFYIQNELNYPELLPLIVPTAQKSELIHFDEPTKDLAKMNTYLGECRIADFIKTKLSNNHVLDIDWTKYTKFDDGSELTAEQSNALKLFCEKDFILLTGSAGCGKTKSLQAILDLCDDNRLTYSLFAFTGAASLRITEATHRPASTIHRPYYQEREFDSDVIVCDEFSMDDIEAICMLLSMISNPNAKVIFVGDNFQLLPIGCGNPFNDIINSHSAPNNTLTQVFRYNSSGLLFVATNVRKGIDFFDDEIVKKEGNVYKVYNNYRFYDVDEEDIVDTVVQVYTEYLKKYKPKDILTTSPFNVGDCGTYAINNIIQNIVNPSKPNEPCLTRKIGQITINFRVGDKVINKKNDYKALTLESYQMIEESGGLLSADDVPHTTVFNGQIGYIRDLNEKYCTIQFDEELLVFDKNKMAHDVLLGYCISVHSSQGGSAKATLNIVSEKHRRMHNRNIFYVAGTRAEEIHTDIGSVKAFKEGIKIDGNKQRDTFLKELLIEEQGLDN